MLFTIRRPLTNEKVNLEITVKFHKPTSDIPLEAFRDVPYGPRSVGCCLAGPAAAWPLPERSLKERGRWSGEAARAAGGRVKKGRQLPHGSEGLGAGGHQPTRHLPVCSPVQGTASLLGEDEQRSVKGERFGENTNEEAPASHRRLPLGPRVAGESCSGAGRGSPTGPSSQGRRGQAGLLLCLGRCGAAARTRAFWAQRQMLECARYLLQEASPFLIKCE